MKTFILPKFFPLMRELTPISPIHSIAMIKFMTHEEMIVIDDYVLDPLSPALYLSLLSKTKVDTNHSLINI